MEKQMSGIKVVSWRNNNAASADPVELDQTVPVYAVSWFDRALTKGDSYQPIAQAVGEAATADGAGELMRQHGLNPSTAHWHYRPTPTGGGWYAYEGEGQIK